MKKKISKRAIFLKLLLSGAFFWILISFVQTNQLVQVISRIDWVYFSLSFILSPIMLVVSCLKWKMVLDLQEEKISFFRLIRIYLIGYFFSNLLPSTVGGDVARSYYSGKIIKNQSFSAIAIFIERFSGVFLLFFLVILSPLIKTDLYKSSSIYVPAIGSFFLILVTLWIWQVQNPLGLPHRLAQWVFSFLFKIVSFPGLISIIEVLEKKYQVVHRKLEKLHVELGTAVTTIRKDRSLLIRIICVTVLFHLLTWLNVYVAFLAFGIKPEFLGICALVSTVLFVAQIPVTLLGNLGFFESVFVFYFMLIDIPGAETLAMALLLRLKMLTIGGVGYMVYLSYSDAKYISEEFEQLKQSV
jgi:uncharacterized protein (TIRG00374 family)